MEKDFIKSFCNILSRLSSFNSKEELIKSFLQYFFEISACESVSLYLIDQDSFEILLSGIEGRMDEEEINKIYFELVEKEIIAALLNNPDEKIKSSLENYNIIPLPVKMNNLTAGFFLFIFEKEQLLDTDTEVLLNHFCDYFSLQLKNISRTQFTNSEKELQIDSPNSLNNIFSVGQYDILNWLKEGLLIIDKTNGKILNANEQAAKILKTEKEKIIGTDKSNYFLFFDKNIFDDEIITEDETILIDSKGNPIPVLYSVSRIIIDKTEYEILSFLDITERKSMEDLILQSRFHLEQMVEERTKELSISNEELQRQIQERVKKEEENLILYLAIQQSPAHVILTNLEGNIEFVNNAFIQQTGYALEEVIGQNPRIFKSGDLNPATYQRLWENIKSGKSWTGEFRNRKKNGELFWVSSLISPILDSNGKTIKYLAIQEDISQRKQYEEELIDSKKKIEKAFNFKNALLANMSHEFRTPLISIIGCSDLLMEDLKDEDQLELIKAIQQGGNRLLKTLNNVLLLSDLDSGDFNSELVPLNIIPILNTLTDKYSYIAQSKNLKLITQVKQDELILHVNEFFFNKALENIIDNAVKYTLEGSVTVSVNQEYINGNPFGVIIVADSGIGIKESEKQRVFEAFRQAEEGHKRNYEGTGLGLTIAQKAIANMNGFIKLEDNIPRGTIFSVYLPAQKILQTIEDNHH